MNFTFYARFNTMAVRDGIEAAADYAVRMGFSSVEFLESTSPNARFLAPDTKKAAEIRKILADRGLTVACYSVGTTLWQNPQAVESLKRHAEIAAALGSPFLHHTLLLWLTKTPDLPEFAPAMEYVTDAAADVARHAAPLGVTCLYEDQGMYANGVENFGIFFKEIRNRCANTGVCGDIGNILFVDEEPEAFFAAYAGDIRHVHMKDYLRKSAPVSPGRYWMPTAGGSWIRDTMVGHGVIDFGACMKILKDAGYTGAWALENDHPEPFEEGVVQAMQYLKRYE